MNREKLLEVRLFQELLFVARSAIWERLGRMAEIGAALSDRTESGILWEDECHLSALRAMYGLVDSKNDRIRDPMRYVIVTQGEYDDVASCAFRLILPVWEERQKAKEA